MCSRIQPIDYQQLARRLLAGGYTTVTLARALGVSQPTVSRLATGKHRSLAAHAALKLIVLAGGSVTLPEAGGDGVCGHSTAEAGVGAGEVG